VVLAHWGFFGILLTAAELVIGIGLLLGIATRLAALGALVLIVPLWLMLLHTTLTCGNTRWTCSPSCSSRSSPPGRTAGLDHTLAARFDHRWPF